MKTYLSDKELEIVRHCAGLAVADHFDRDLQELRLLGTRIKSLKPEDMLIYLCIHGTSHCWERLEMICSVAVLAGGGMIQDWTRVFIRAKALGCYRMVLLGLDLARHCFAVDLPPAVARAVAQDVRMEKVSGYILDRMTKGEAAFSENLNWRFLPMHFQVRDSFRNRAAYFFRLFFRPTVREWDQYPLPERFLFLYPVLRPFRLFLRGVTRKESRTPRCDPRSLTSYMLNTSPFLK